MMKKFYYLNCLIEFKKIQKRAAISHLESADELKKVFEEIVLITTKNKCIIQILKKYFSGIISYLIQII